MTNFDDMMVDYPYAKDYAFDLFVKLHELQLLDDQQLSKYKQHVDNLANLDDIEQWLLCFDKKY